MKLTNHTILITGGALPGLGGGLAEAFHKRGNKVIITGRKEQPLKEMAAKFPGMETFAMDVAKEADAKRLFDFISQKYPNLDVLVNNAGVMQWPDFAKLERLDEHLFDEIDINLKGLIRMTAVFLPLLNKQKEAFLINVSSGLAYMPLASAPIYCATKTAVHFFSMSLRHQLRHGPVRVIELAPPAVESNLGQTPGMPKNKYPRINLETFISLTMKALESGKEELPIGQSKFLRLGSRFAPSAFFKMLNPS